MESALWGIGFLPCSMLDLLLWDVSHHATKTLKNRSGEPQMRRYQAFLPVWLYASASTKLAALWPMLTGPKLHPASDAGEATPSCGVIKTHKLPIQTPPNPRTLEWCDAMHVNFPLRNFFVCLFVLVGALLAIFHGSEDWSRPELCACQASALPARGVRFWNNLNKYWDTWKRLDLFWEKISHRG